MREKNRSLNHAPDIAVCSVGVRRERTAGMRCFRICLAFFMVTLIAFRGTAAFGAIADTPHDMSDTLVRYGCELCHLPHGPYSDGLWAVRKQTEGTGWNLLPIGLLCGSCHYGTPAYAALCNVAHDMTEYAYNAQNHGYQTARLASRAKQDSQAMAISGLPSVATATLRCSTCHNPHENVVRPFLRVTSGTVESLCILCHARDNGDGSVPLYGAGNSINGFSHHPVNIPYVPGDKAGTPALKPLDANRFATTRGIASRGRISVDDALGGKLLGPDGTTGNMGCPTCHQVHGDGATPTVNPWLLVVKNRISTAETGGPDHSALCEACHAGGLPGGTVLSGSSKDHPIDNQVSGRNHFDWTPWGSSRAYESTEDTWPKIGGKPRAGCTSCHSAHYGLAGSPMQRSYAQVGGVPFDPAPTADARNASGWCDSCHTGNSKAPFGHHSVRDTYAASIIDCGDCHRGGTSDTTIATAQVSAHRNWMALDLPVSPSPVDGRRANFCLKCHAGTAFTPIVGTLTTIGVETVQLGTFNPTTPTGRAVFPAIHGTKRGSGGNAVSSHYLGATKKLASGDNVTTPRILPWESGFYSVYADQDGNLKGNATTGNYGKFAVTDRIICESCHNVLHNAGSVGNTSGSFDSQVAVTASPTSGFDAANGVNLLLERFVDDAKGVGQAGSTIGSALCVGCHRGGEIARNILNVNTHRPDGTHPMTGATVSKAVDMGRVPATLITATTGYANASGVPGILSYPGEDKMDCDSCHRAHDGAAGSAKEGAIPVGFNYVLEQANSNSDVQSICTQCHSY